MHHPEALLSANLLEHFANQLCFGVPALNQLQLRLIMLADHSGLLLEIVDDFVSQCHKQLLKAVALIHWKSLLTTFHLDSHCFVLLV